MVAVDEADGFRFRTAFERLRGALQRQILDEDYTIAIREDVAVGILNDAGFLGLGFAFPFVPAGHALPAIGVFQNIGHFTHGAGRVAHREAP